MDALVAIANARLQRYALACRGACVIFQIQGLRTLDIGDKVTGILETFGRTTWDSERHGRLEVFVEDFHLTLSAATRWVSPPQQTEPLGVAALRAERLSPPS